MMWLSWGFMLIAIGLLVILWKEESRSTEEEPTWQARNEYEKEWNYFTEPL